MGWPMFLGCAMIALGPALSIFYWVIGENAVLVCCFVFSGFLWVCSFTLGSVFYKIAASEVWILVLATVATCELARWGLYVMARDSARHIFSSSQSTVAPKDSLTRRPAVAIACGLGLGVAQTMVAHGQVLVESRGPGTYYSEGCSVMPYFVSVAVQCALLTVVQVLWTLLLFDGLRRSRPAQIYGVVGGHFFMAGLNMFITGHKLAAGCILMHTRTGSS